MASWCQSPTRFKFHFPISVIDAALNICVTCSHFLIFYGGVTTANYSELYQCYLIATSTNIPFLGHQRNRIEIVDIKKRKYNHLMNYNIECFHSVDKGVEIIFITKWIARHSQKCIKALRIPKQIEQTSHIHALFSVRTCPNIVIWQMFITYTKWKGKKYCKIIPRRLLSVLL